MQGNTATGNQPTGDSLVSGGIVVHSSAILGGTDPVGNLVRGNLLRDNTPDLAYDGSGTGNTFAHNSCSTSSPDGLC